MVARAPVRRPRGELPLLVKIAIAQCAPALGAMKRNLDMHRDWIAKARAAGSRLVIFPELSLTGYYLKDLASDVACAADDPQLARIAEASRDIDISAGFVERSADAKLHIAQGHWSGGKLLHVHRKVYLPTYGIFDDGRYFGPGDRFGTFESAAGVAGVAICEDLWHLSVPYLYAIGGASVVLAPASSPGRGVAEGGDLGTAASCRMMDRFYAQYLTLYVVFANRVGHEDGIGFWGGSEVIGPDGTVCARAAEWSEVLLVSGGVDSAVVAALAAEALGPAQVLGLFTPYRSIGSRSREDANDVARVFGIRLEEVPITGQVDAYFANEPKAHRVRVGNKM